MIKIWSLEASEDIKTPKMIWMLIEQLNYKNLPVNSLSFSQDSSILIGGFGNALCIYDSYTMKLKCVLSAPAATDGSTNRALISMASGKLMRNNVSNVLEKRQKLLQMMESVIKDPKSSSDLIKNITEDKKRSFTQKSASKIKTKNLKVSEKKEIFLRVLSNSELNFNQKLQILHKLNIYYKISNRIEDEVFKFMMKQATEEQQLYRGLQKNINLIKNDAKYKIQWRFKMWKMRDLRRNRRIVTVRKLLKQTIADDRVKERNEAILPIKNATQITNVLFCNNDLSHIAVATTPSRILIWNLLTLKIQGSFKIHTNVIAHDPRTNLVAVFSKYNEVYIIHPSPALTIFHQANVPNIYGAVWIPQTGARSQSISVNWQAHSQLLFLTYNQEICCFSSPFDEEFIDPIACMDAQKFLYKTPFAAMLSKQVVSDKSTDVSNEKIASTMGNNKEVSKDNWSNTFIIN
jgi:NET1-associated nuclear protein 1 (U3 small nucleolar RNA-associated protein 17)